MVILIEVNGPNLMNALASPFSHWEKGWDEDLQRKPTGKIFFWNATTEPTKAKRTKIHLVFNAARREMFIELRTLI